MADGIAIRDIAESSRETVKDCCFMTLLCLAVQRKGMIINMTNRETFLNFVRNGGEHFICSPQIGAGAGFDTKVSGKTWYSETSYRDTIKTCEMFDMVPLYNFGLPDLAHFTKDIKWEAAPVTTNENGRRFYKNTFVTPKGSLVSTVIEDEFKGSCQTKYLITDESELDILEYYLDSLLEVTDFSPLTTRVVSREVRNFGTP